MRKYRSRLPVLTDADCDGSQATSPTHQGSARPIDVCAHRVAMHDARVFVRRQHLPRKRGNRLVHVEQRIPTLTQVLERHRAAYGKAATREPAQAGEMGGAARQAAEIATERPDVGAAGALDSRIDRS